MDESNNISRISIFKWLLFFAFSVSAIAMFISGVPLVLAILLSPLAFFRGFVYGGACTFIWVLAITVRIIAISENKSSLLTAFDSILMALIVGLTPHAVFLILLNLAPTELPRNIFFSVAQWYEINVQKLQDIAGPLLMLPFSIGVLAAFAIFLIRVWMPKSTAGPRLAAVLSMMRACGLALIAATSFTVISAVPAEGWNPNTAMALQAAWKKNIKQNVILTAKLSVVEILISELQDPKSNFRSNLSYINRNYAFLDGDDKYRIGEISYIETKSRGDIEINNFSNNITQDKNMAPPSPELIDVVTLSNMELEARVNAARELLSGVVGSLFGWASEKYVDGFLSAFIEDAVTRLTSDSLIRRSASDILTTTISETHMKLELLKRQMSFDALPIILQLKQIVQQHDFIISASTRARNIFVRAQESKASTKKFIRRPR